MNRKILVILTALILVANVAKADFSLDNWQFKKELIPPSSLSQKTFGEVVFDKEIFGRANRELSDIRVVDSGGIEVPYVLSMGANRSQEDMYAAKILNKGSVPGQYTIFTVDLGRDGILHNKVEVLTDSLNFRRDTTLESSNDMQNWINIAPRKSIYDYSLEFKVKDTSISYTDSTARFLRVKIFDNGEAPINILGAKVYRETVTSLREVRYPSSIVGRQLNQEYQTSEITVDLGQKGLPTYKVILTTADLNFNRSVNVLGSNDAASWTNLSQDIIFSYDTPKFQGDKLYLEYPESNYRYLKIIIINKDNQPIGVENVTAFGLLRKLIFDYNPSLKYVLYYGNTQARFPEYDLKNYLDYFDKGNIREIFLGPESLNGSYKQPAIPQKPVSERFPNLLLVLLIIATAVIGFLAFRLFKKAPGTGSSTT